MRRKTILLGPTLAFLLGTGMGETVQPLLAQSTPGELSRTQFGIGYVANAPDLLAGVGAYVLFPAMGGIGVYVDAKFDTGNPSGDLAFQPGLTPDEVEGEMQGSSFIKREGSWRSFNVGLVRPLSPFLFAYGGAGYAKGSYYRLYEVVVEGIGRALWVEAPDDEESRVNLMAGVFLRLTATISTQFGFETQPGGVTAGASLRLPRW
ncbi:MAG: hypothetical protein MUO50_05955 [Longimicrobiales bacterium]|nr:hypothetical protein [Longimicrobiales bacterium]